MKSKDHPEFKLIKIKPLITYLQDKFHQLSPENIILWINRFIKN